MHREVGGHYVWAEEGVTDIGEVIMKSEHHVMGMATKTLCPLMGLVTK